MFLISLKARRVPELPLTAAEPVILYAPWWNPAVKAQAENEFEAPSEVVMGAQPLCDAVVVVVSVIFVDPAL